jgi:hypothetical protein
MQFQRNISLLLARRCVGFYPCRRGLHEGEFRLGGREMCVGGIRLGCRELHVGELHTRPQRAGQVEAEVFPAADQASGPRGGGGSGLPHHGRAAQLGRWSSCVCG